MQKTYSNYIDFFTLTICIKAKGMKLKNIESDYITFRVTLFPILHVLISQMYILLNTKHARCVSRILHCYLTQVTLDILLYLASVEEIL